ncbi:NUDIX domain-containing protein [Winkia sp. ACRQY]|uniref:NUDIX domain-containing protein n=1 Tax=Winkia neuii subsp. anitrata TaxID=29318 RepID=A0AB38XLG0_9ACTO|nr:MULTISPECIES: NUDIX domain-containing protein [Winkia]MCG7301861.1 NUDIX domain-containing protein [Winkia sp. ACRQY]MDK7162596.1 NUDIX domain-containing protein [Winkia sp. UMB3105]MDK8594169.1 NUDIX domain-containing protein [Winkia sp. UMB1096A]MDU2268830.1 NUDIX domain-containing protein [Winkia neuii]WCE45181.1 NUDIX domain-containing protein [Winkia neuii subsp. anitrata]
MSDWTMGPDGIPFRNAARVILFDAQGNTLLIEGHDKDNPSRHWWFTVGGGLQEGEGAREGACRELAEETGIELSASQLLGPAIYRKAIFDFARGPARQHETFFVAYLDGREKRIDRKWTQSETQVLDGYRWFDQNELCQLQKDGAALYPAELFSLLNRWQHGYDGHVQHIGINESGN